jgi:hypothetical protein
MKKLLPALLLLCAFISYSQDTITPSGKGRIKIKATLGFSMGKITFKDDGEEIYSFDRKPAFAIGGEAEYFIPGNRNKWALFANPDIQFYKVEKSQSYPGYSYIIHREVKYQTLELPVGLRHYMFLNDHSKLFINGGYNFSFILKSEIKAFYFPYDSKNAGNLFLGTGYTYKKLSAEIRFNFNRKIGDESDTQIAQYNSFGIIAGYSIF